MACPVEEGRLDYALLKALHQTAAGLSILGFTVRLGGHLCGAAWVHGRAAKTLPHALDTVLLLSALGLVWQLQLPVMQSPWLQAKLLGLLAYILLGMLALGTRLPRRWRAAAGGAAWLTVAWMVSVALSKDPRGFLGSLLV